ncbi:AAA domain-containing protein, putative AbiEii toxin, Type IV TA system [Paenibacillus sp. CF095]|uniref:AAA family ATPase n=1 Tax=Paenibacillus sp. CF095 TaxID=1881033 RepID=UPI0008888B90|nr:AAA family ATPase [Paenibacillus sp. CF095]SDC24989.1 AAA domain-containing protein, putative AbiEii toxin, Type IV TA system [Paenibacillus sp. CF095]
MLKKIRITELFGIKDNVVNLNFNEKLSIIVGKNGSGKTTVLDIVNYILTKEFDKLLEYSFKKIELESTSGIIWITKIETSIHIKRIDVSKAADEYSKKNKLAINEEALNKISQVILQDEPSIYTLFDDLELQLEFDDFVSSIYIVLNSKDPELNESKKIMKSFIFTPSSLYFPTYRRIETELVDIIIEPLLSLSRQFPKHFIDERVRLYNNTHSRTIIGLSNKDISNIVNKKWNETVEFEKKQLNSLLERFFISLLEPPSTEVYSASLSSFNDNSVRYALDEVYRKTGLLGKQGEHATAEIDRYVGSVMEAKKLMESTKDLQEDTFQKYQMALKISIIHEKVNRLLDFYKETNLIIEKKKEPFINLSKILNTFLDKKVIIKEGNIVFKKDAKELLFEDLSAGEKQLIAMFVYTRLSVNENSVVIIDEPELSLHIGWQRKLINALTSGKQNVQYIISTHSPFVMSNYDEEIEVLGPLGDEENDEENEIEDDEFEGI